METLNDLMQVILNNTHTIVFSNLGRYPEILFNALESLPNHLQISVQSPRIHFPSTLNRRISVIQPNRPLDPCGLLLVVEPSPKDSVQKPLNAQRIVVFTCQLNFVSCPEIIWTRIVYFHTPNLQAMIDGTQRLLSLQDGSVQAADAKFVKVADAMNKVIVRGRTKEALTAQGTYVVVDLVHHTSPFEMLISFWDAFDFMLANAERVRGWLVCFPLQNGRRSFEQFTQNCLDKLFCMSIDHGNVKSLAKLLALVPFYKSGCIDRVFDFPASYFGNVKYVAVKSAQDACRAATKYDMEHWVGSIYHVKE